MLHLLHRTAARFSVALVVLLPLVTMSATTHQELSLAAQPPGTDAFQRTWARTDQPVASGAVSRTWMWGPEAFTEVMHEPYAESPGGMRKVQYFDKSRMEITHPDAVDDGVWYVTNGLLVVEMVTGQLQTGDERFESRSPAQVNVAGDADDPTGPTYATFGPLRSMPALADNAPVIQRVDRAGTVTDDASLAGKGVTAAHRVTVPRIDHQVASPFWEFMTSSGTVFQNGQNVTAQLFLDPFYATGYPITEAYWARVKVANTYKDVLMQCFERRCLTFTPDNPPGWRVEAGNVGRHYDTWRNGAGPANHVVINEVLFRPEEDNALQSVGAQWVELFNPTAAAVDLTGWQLTDAARARAVGLPAWALPAGGYLLVRLDAGTNDSSLADGCGVYYADQPGAVFVKRFEDGVALYRGTPGQSALVDFVSWSYSHVAPPGAARNDAVATGNWPDGGYVAAAPYADGADTLTWPTPAGVSIGRDKTGADTDVPADWSSWGGADAYTTSPCTANDQDRFWTNDAGPADAARTTQAVVKKQWTVIMIFDSRDPGLAGGDLQTLKSMETMAADFTNLNVVYQSTWVNNGVTDSRRWVIQHDVTYDDADPANDIQFATSPAYTPVFNNPGSSETVAEAISWSKERYPADHYIVVFGGHGLGWRGLAMHGALDYLNMRDLRRGMQALGQPADVVLFEACLMGQVEVAAQLHGVANYMVASEEVTWGGWPLDVMFAELSTHPNRTAAEFSIDAATRIDATMAGFHTLTPGVGFDRRTISAVDVRQVHDMLLPRLKSFALALQADVPNRLEQDQSRDNGQVVIRRDVREKAETFHVTDYIDLGDFARLVGMQPLLPSSPRPGREVHQMLTEKPGKVVLVSLVGPAHVRSTGLSIYFPEYQTIDPRTPPATPFGTAIQLPYDNPWADPNDEFKNTHLYKRDGSIELARLLRGENHPMRDEPEFLFTAAGASNAAEWAAFLLRYYKPVADACIWIDAGHSECVDAVSRKVGETVELFGQGSSDSDTYQDTNEPWDWYWDLDASRDPDGVTQPVYQFGQAYFACTDMFRDDCDRDEQKELDDYADARGKTALFTCTEPGTFTMTLWVQDDQHTSPRTAFEDTSINQGRHWVHFQVDVDKVYVTCGDGPQKLGPASIGSANETIDYMLIFPAGPGAGEDSLYQILDFLPEGASLAGPLNCSPGVCQFLPEYHVFNWNGSLLPGQTFVLNYSVTIDDGPGPPPTEMVNCARFWENDVEVADICVTTTIGAGGSMPPPVTVPAVAQLE